MGDAWRKILAQQVAEKSAGEVARELGISPTTVSLVLSGKYGASTDNIERKVSAIYGDGGQVTCPVLGRIDPSRCADTWELAHKIGVRAGNPAKIKLYKTCLKCPLRA